MATKTISLEIDAYDKLKAAKRSEKDSFSSVVRRAVFPARDHTASAILRGLVQLPPGSIPPTEVLEYLDKAIRENRERPRISPSAWDESHAS